MNLRESDVLQHPTRAAIVELLRAGELSAGEIAERAGVRRPSLSHHLTVLASMGFVRCQPRGARRYYSLTERLLDAVDAGSMTTTTGARPATETAGSETPFSAAFKRLAQEKGIPLVDQSPRSDSASSFKRDGPPDGPADTRTDHRA
jgi:DNA-binding transcriptional ArsR family regulator